MHAPLAAFITRRWSLPADRVCIHLEPLRGGLESSLALAHVAVEGVQHAVPRRLVVKALPSGLEREAAVYEWLWSRLPDPPAVSMLGHERIGPSTFLYLEHAQGRIWPWADTAIAAAVCRLLGRLHDRTGRETATTFPWDYEQELARSARDTLGLATTARGANGFRHWRRLGDLRRVVRALPSIRQRLLTSERTVIHGDMHPGNALVRSSTGEPEVVLIDWARARLGSPLEDLASWLHSLGCWEPEARRRHDTLVRAYLDSRSERRCLDAAVREEYYLAAASNGLSGAIRYHVHVLSDARSTQQARTNSKRALDEWQRVVTRAAAATRSWRARGEEVRQQS